MSDKPKRGFTHIELLVVVLIIGILAAVALPQYNKAVEKAQFMQVITSMDALRKACEVYYLDKGEYPTQLSQLDINPNLPAGYGVVLYHTSGPTFALDMYVRRNGSVALEYVRYLQISGKSSRYIECRVLQNNPNLHHLCQLVSGKTTRTDTGNFVAYSFYR